MEEHEGQPFIVMELLEGKTLGEIVAAEQIQRRFFPVKGVVDIAILIAEGLEAAHGKGIIHRDIKPANIFVTPHGQVKILDFGLAKFLASADADVPQLVHGAQLGQVSNLVLTQAGVAMGTAGYMSPEQVRGEQVDARTDLFSFGLILYEMATGQRAFTGMTERILHHTIINDTPRSVREFNPTVPRKLEHIIDKALQKDCHLRYQKASEIRDDLENLRRELTPTVPASHRSQIVAAVLGTLLLTTSALYWVDQRRKVIDGPAIDDTEQIGINSDGDSHPFLPLRPPLLTYLFA